MTDLATTRLPDRPRVGRLALGALLAILLFVAGVALWSRLVPINAAILADGRITVQSYRKDIQTREGGRIDQILVKEGAAVSAGDPLLRLDPSQAWSEHDIIRDRLMQTLGRTARLNASLIGADAPDWPAELTGDHASPESARVMTIEATLFEAWERERAGKERVLERRIAELREEAASLAAELRSTDRQLPMIEEETADVATLLSKGLERKPRLLALKRARESLIGERNALRRRIAQAEENLAAAKLNLTAFRSQQKTELAEALTEASNEIATLRQQLKSARDRLRNTELRSPVAGEIVDLAFHTVGGVAAPGETIMSIVPRADELVVDARVRAGDIDGIYRGQLAEVRIGAYRWRNRPPLAARVIRVSADLLEDPATGRQYYEARLRFEAGGETADLKTGMAADIAFLTEERTAADYLLGPVGRELFRGFREP
ncbi:HlyD family type I secretion periplasmic adaptor subunit [Nisaea acidiphila]|uniref:Membrane fusion protein (MFP) family protein n=1 Tax=Nisaea acidiphila TaxID=1862145 RepID=A0A9J7B0T9_9PROT|nr:HlyD family type I secretion periplasmic adaptor subunit [Nisaea acidiphila]UUX51301.1 HlyD family type I secretion periplasmic adaptor subunit [Nisaea acidiphila]